jgi:hypothetical protein
VRRAAHESSQGGAGPPKRGGGDAGGDVYVGGVGHGGVDKEQRGFGAESIRQTIVSNGGEPRALQCEIPGTERAAALESGGIGIGDPRAWSVT